MFPSLPLFPQQGSVLDVLEICHAELVSQSFALKCELVRNMYHYSKLTGMRLTGGSSLTVESSPTTR